MQIKSIIYATIFNISCIVCLRACIYSKDDKGQKKTIYNETALNRIILSTSKVSEKNALNNMDSILNAAVGDNTVFRRIVVYLEKPLSDPNSAYRNENLYIQLLKAKIKSVCFDNIEKAASKARLYLCMQNQKGKAANDFIYITPAGSRSKMYDLWVDFTMLFFYNPECEACRYIKSAIAGSSLITNKLASGELKILAVYTEEDIELWQKHLPQMPKNWIQGRDENEFLYKNNVYDLKAIPTIYLLDKNKKVLLKDCMSLLAIEQALLQYK